MINNVNKSPVVDVLADVENNARIITENVLKPGGIRILQDLPADTRADLIIVDITRMLGDPLNNLRSRRAAGDNTPAIVLAAHFPPSRMRDLFRLGVADIVHKPFRPGELCSIIRERAHSSAVELAQQILDAEWMQPWKSQTAF